MQKFITAIIAISFLSSCANNHRAMQNDLNYKISEPENYSNEDLRDCFEKNKGKKIFKCVTRVNGVAFDVGNSLYKTLNDCTYKNLDKKAYSVYKNGNDKWLQYVQKSYNYCIKTYPELLEKEKLLISPTTSDNEVTFTRQILNYNPRQGIVAKIHTMLPTSIVLSPFNRSIKSYIYILTPDKKSATYLFQQGIKIFDKNNKKIHDIEKLSVTKEYDVRNGNFGFTGIIPSFYFTLGKDINKNKFIYNEGGKAIYTLKIYTEKGKLLEQKTLNLKINK